MLWWRGIGEKIANLQRPYFIYPMKSFNLKLFLLITGILVVLIIPCYWGVRTYELEKAQGLELNGIAALFAKLFYLLRFPTHTLMKSTFQTNGITIFFASLIFNCCLYGLLGERIAWAYKNRNDETPNQEEDL